MKNRSIASIVTATVLGLGLCPTTFGGGGWMDLPPGGYPDTGNVTFLGGYSANLGNSYGAAAWYGYNDSWKFGLAGTRVHDEFGVQGAGTYLIKDKLWFFGSWSDRCAARCNVYSTFGDAECMGGEAGLDWSWNRSAYGYPYEVWAGASLAYGRYTVWVYDPETGTWKICPVTGNRTWEPSGSGSGHSEKKTYSDTTVNAHCGVAVTLQNSWRVGTDVTVYSTGDLRGSAFLAWTWKRY